MAIDLHNTASRLLGKLAANKASAYLQLERQTGAVQDPNTEAAALHGACKAQLH